MRRSTLLLPLVGLLAFGAGCEPEAPPATCAWEFPADDGERVAASAGFNLFVTVTGQFTNAEVPRVDFFSDREVGNAHFEELYRDDPLFEEGSGKFFEGSLAMDGADCSTGCQGGGRFQDSISPGVTHTITARALAANGAIACEITRTVDANGLPTVSGLTISPDPAGSADDLSVTGTASDPEGDATTINYKWTNDVEGVEFSGELLSRVNTVAGETWTVTATARDSFGDFGPPTTTEITLSNTPPSAPAVTITPVPGRVSAPLRCRVDNLSGLDPDAGQELSVRWSWTRDGADAGVDTDLVGPDLTAAGEEWECTAVVFDGFDEGAPGRAATTVVPALDVVGDVPASGGASIRGTWINQRIGDKGRLGSPGDLDGDGGAEVVVTENSTVVSVFGDEPGNAYLYTDSELTGELDLNDAAVHYQGRAGLALSAPAPVGDLNGDGYQDMVLGFRHPSLPTSFGNNGVYIVWGGENALDEEDVDLEETATKIVGRNQVVGESPCPIGDLDGDGYDELALTAPQADGGQGIVYVVYGHPGIWLSGETVDSLQPGFRLDGAAALDFMGEACAGPTDLDGDGLHDVVVSAPGSGGVGRVFGWLSDGERWSGSVSASTAAFILSGPGDGAGLFGLEMAALSDFDGDGSDDFAVYAQGADGEAAIGAVWIVSGADEDLTGGVDVDALPTRILGGRQQTRNGPGSSMGFCATMTSVDLNGDGLGDLACGDLQADVAAHSSITGGPSARIFYGAEGGLGAELTYADADVFILQGSSGESIGTGLAALPDVDGDSYSELLVGAPAFADPHEDQGRVYIVNLAD